MATVRIRNIVNHEVRDMPGSTEMLRGPYDLGGAKGPVEYQGGGVVTYTDHSGPHFSRVREGRLAEAHPCEWVLVHYDVPPDSDGRAWWPCEVVAVNGDDASV
jgi:hypothetical protein